MEQAPLRREEERRARTPVAQRPKLVGRETAEELGGVLTLDVKKGPVVQPESAPEGDQSDQPAQPEKDEPQPQLFFAFGLMNVKPLPVSPSAKSIVVPWR